MKCKHCGNIILCLDKAGEHSCFIGKDIYLDGEEDLYTPANDIDIEDIHVPTPNVEKKQAAIWDNNTTLSLLTLYETKVHMLDHPKKKTRIWEAISTDLQKTYGIQMSANQVRWKINALMKKYKECVDNNCRSGTSPMTFQWFDVIDDIVSKGKNANSVYTISSQFNLTSEPSTSTSEPSPSISEPLISTKAKELTLNTTCTTLSVSSKISNVAVNRKRPLHGSGSNLARSKLALEQKWFDYLNKQAERHKLYDENQAAILDLKKEMMKAKKKDLKLKEEDRDNKKEYLNQKLKLRRDRDTEMIKIEKEKCALLKRLLKGDSD